MKWRPSRSCSEGCAMKPRAFKIEVNPPIRRKRHELVEENSLRKAVQLALLQQDCGSVLILFDADDDCPKELAAVPRVGPEGRSSFNAGCSVVIANREYEAWFLATMESLLR